MIQFDEAICGNLKLALEKEWLETNSCGSYSSSTIINAHSRRYHGLLVASPDGASRRVVFLSKLEEQVIIGEHAYSLACNVYPETIYPTGFMYQKEFRLDPFPTFVYQLDEVTIEKKIILSYESNTVLVVYSIVSGATDVFLKVRPLVAFRPYHDLLKEDMSMHRGYTVRDRMIMYQAYDDLTPLYFSHDGLMIEGTALWYYNFMYAKEKERGFKDREDLFNPFEITYMLTKDKPVFCAVSLDATPITNMYEIEHAEIVRRSESLHSGGGEKKGMMPPEKWDPGYRQLLSVTDAFLVKKDGVLSGIVAGFPWFQEQFRDTFIALPGLTLVQGRFDVARNILKRSIGFIQKGELPSYISEETSLPVYTSFETSLWFFYAVYKYIRYTNDFFFVVDELYDAMKQCIQYFFTNPSKHVYVDTDNLLVTVNEHARGAWKEDSREKSLVKSRVGKLVDVNALWFTAIKVLEYIAHASKSEADFFRYHDLALRVRESFQESFWNEEKGYLYDCVKGSYREDAVRPYQILAISLPFELIEKKESQQVLECIERNLLTMVGLRTLSEKDSTYIGKYVGDWYSRDAAYHQGCVIPFFMGLYVDAYMKLNEANETSQDVCKVLLKALFHHAMNDGGLGYISEVFDGTFPHVARGAIAHATSVAEVVRVYHEHVLARKAFSSSLK
jgi:predicted glycogen debranching enzyme